MKLLLKSHLTLMVLCVFLAVLLVLKPAQVPPLWYDEGFVLSLACNWVVLGHYGHLLLGQPVPAVGSTSGFPVMAPVALSFRIFGIGVLQARLPGIIYTTAALSALYILANRLYDREVAFISMFVVSLISSNSGLHPVIVGRQALGEIPAQFYLLTGFILFSYSKAKRLWPFFLAMVFWAIAMQTKPQTLPFFIICLVLPLFLALWQRYRKTVLMLTSALVGTMVIFGLFSLGLKLLQSSQSLSPNSIVGIYDQAFDIRNWLTYWLVLDPAVRLGATLVVAIAGMPLVLGLCYTGRLLVRNSPAINWDNNLELCRLMLWTFSTSWLVWYLLFSIGWARYLFPAMFSGTVFISVLLQKLSGPFFNPLHLIQRGARVLHERLISLQNTAILLVAISVPLTIGLTVIMLGTNYLAPSNDSVYRVVDYINMGTPAGSVIESTDVELFFLLDRPYHYPPVSLMPDLNRRTFLAQNVVIDYDPLVADPDYLIVGRFGRMWRLYEPILATGAFRLLNTYGDYEVFSRVREGVKLSYLHMLL